MKKKTVQRLICSLLAMALLLAGIPASALDELDTVTEAQEETIAAKLDSITSNLSEAVALEEDQVSSLVDFQINTYIQTEQVAENNTILQGDASSWIPLHDVEGSHFANLVPLVTEEEGEIGYIVVSAIEDGFTHYMMAWDTGLLEAYRAALENDPEAQAVFFPPMDYGLQSGQGENRRIWKIDMSDYELKDITEVVAENAQAFREQYQLIRSQKNAQKVELFIDNSEEIALQAAEESSSSLRAANVAQIDARLECEKLQTPNFLRIREYDSKNNITTYRYGGNQSWYDSTYKQDRGCGPVAAANIMCYMAISSSTYSKLYTKSLYSRTKEEFTEFMDTMYDVIGPALWGESSHVSFANDLVKWAKDQGVTLTAHRFNVRMATRDEAANEIIKALNKDKPVAMLNLNKGYVDPEPNSQGYSFGWHWVTATKYFQSIYDARWVAVSSWGQRFSLNWDTYYQSMADPLPSFGGGFAWFE